MITNIVLFEHPTHSESLYPFSIMHLPWELRIGLLNILETWQKLSGASVLSLHGRPLHLESFTTRNPQYRSRQLGVGSVLALSSLLLPRNNTLIEIRKAETSVTPVAFIADGQLVAACCSLSDWERLNVREWNELEHVISSQHWDCITLTDFRIIRYLWDLFDNIPDTITEQFSFCADQTIHHADFVHGHVAALNPERIAVGENSSIAPFVVLDASSGPILIGNNVTIMPHVTIIGPCAIGDHTIVKAGARIYPNTVIGQWCKIGGEVDTSIFQNYTNKQHEGFVGHSFISEWVNIGADTNTSNLKNTYRPISVEFPTGRIPTGRTFLGLLCGDHTKVGINTMFTTGTVVGICSNIFGSGYTPNYIPSYTWGGITTRKLLSLETALDTARRSMARRQKALTVEEIRLLQNEYEHVQKLFC
ncbi:MAG: putative sugar nucleotidyl transferase [Bacteroidota bacterium]|nr:putative sugar nucleotidyl transferase [Candidatus Kapabacteria bacterium]MCX7936797.1 putative sugar nucleotidyl transferase [Chlorobiota bacterium]MDW8074516.1 putative sugar nucleotidyl transferase [Bacteroidota bacterium]MDW8271008.1 putative sugar nucleotidyl transferase [Bacteroidota bacterium]